MVTTNQRHMIRTQVRLVDPEGTSRVTACRDVSPARRRRRHAQCRTRPVRRIVRVAIASRSAAPRWLVYMQVVLGVGASLVTIARTLIELFHRH
ncbi:hypothetical protein [Krasilnikovia cinnamomea]|nr:hypothetical protein [Krasilnikovia cinnamomea]